MSIQSKMIHKIRKRNTHKNQVSLQRETDGKGPEKQGQSRHVITKMILRCHSLNGLIHKFLTYLWGTATDTYLDTNIKSRVKINTPKDCRYIPSFLDRLEGKEH